MGKKVIKQIEDESSQSDEEYDQDDIEQYDDDDSFDKNNKDLIEASSDESDEQNILDWGKKKQNYYQAGEDEDFSDEEQEEMEANEIQKRITQRMTDEAFFDHIEEQKEEQMNEEIDPNIQKRNLIKKYANITEEERFEIIQNKSPEILNLIEEYRSCVLELQDEVDPIMQLSNLKNQNEKNLQNVISLKGNYVRSYCSFLLYYLLNCIEQKSVKHHPVVKSLIQSKQRLEQVNLLLKKHKKEIKELVKLSKAQSKDYHNNDIDKINLKIAKSKIQNAPQQNQHFQEVKRTSKDKIKKALQKNNDFKLNNSAQKLSQLKKILDDDEEKFQISKSSKQIKPQINDDLDLNDDSAMDSFSSEDEFMKDVKQNKNNKKKDKIRQDVEASKFQGMDLREVGEDDPRKINYMMLKNKGLTRNRKKIDRNGRVKLKNKYAKAVVKNKSKGNFHRKLKQGHYEGEMAGIKSGVIRSTSLKN